MAAAQNQWACDSLHLPHAEQLMYGLEQIKATVGPAEQSGFTDQEIKDTLYHFYFDIEQSLNWILGTFNEPVVRNLHLIGTQRSRRGGMRFKNVKVSYLLSYFAVFPPFPPTFPLHCLHFLTVEAEMVSEREGACRKSNPAC